MNDTQLAQAFNLLNARLFKKENFVLRDKNTSPNWAVTTYAAEGFTLEVDRDSTTFTITGQNFELISFVDGSFSFNGDKSRIEVLLSQNVA
jgi:hypothetical protein